MTYETLINEFCKAESDQLYSANTRRRRSMLLELRKDIDFNLGIYGTFRNLDLTDSQLEQIVKLSPLLTVPLLYCSAIDLIARVKNKVTTVHGMNAAFFKESAQMFFELNETQSNEIWKLRNLLSHQYSIRDYTISRSGSQEVYELHENGHKVIFVRAMRGSIKRASDKLFDYLMQENLGQQEKTISFLETYGFSYYLVT